MTASRHAMAALCMMILAAGLLSQPVASAQSEPTQRLPLRAAMHVHSTVSTGRLSLEALARRAEEQGLDVLVLTDNFTLRYDYGIRPFEGLLKHQLTFPSVMEYGIGRFLDEVRAVGERHPNLILVPGVEVAPYYRWTGSLSGRDLTMHEAQRNLLVIGLEQAEDYAALPARGNPQSFVWDQNSFVNGLPLLLGVPALWIWWPVRRRVHRHGPESQRRRACAGIVLAGTAALGLHAWPFTSPAFSSYQDRAGYEPYQALIDAATQRGGLVFWSMTEARDFSEHAFGPLGMVTVKTEPHPEALVLTRGYTGFGGLYQDTRRVVAPGGIWDQVLQTTMSGLQQPGPTMIGEIAFHGFEDAGKDLDRVYTVLSVTERTEHGVLEALRSGHAYAVARGDDRVLLTLDDFRVIADHGTPPAGGPAARIGDRLDAGARREIQIHAALSTADQRPHPAKLRLIRSGQVIHQLEGQTPLRLDISDRDAPAGQWLIYRVEVTGKSGELLTNPIYVRRGGEPVSGQPPSISAEVFSRAES
jgi:hypothetical protein